MAKYVILWLCSVLLSAFSQVLLKIAANRKYPNRVREYLNPLVAGAYALFLLCTLMTMFALRVVPYSWSPMIESTSYIFVPLFGVLHHTGVFPCSGAKIRKTRNTPNRL